MLCCCFCFCFVFLTIIKAGRNWAEPKKEERQATEPIKVELPAGYSQTVGPAGQITIAKLPVLREQLESRVFRPGYNMATMSVEEAGEIDYQEMLERTEREKQAAARKVNEICFGFLVSCFFFLFRFLVCLDLCKSFLNSCFVSNRRKSRMRTMLNIMTELQCTRIEAGTPLKMIIQLDAATQLAISDE